MKTELIKTLQDMRFSDYEAKVYLALLDKSPLTGYAASLQSGVPRSRIYGVLANLVNRGDVLVSQEDTSLYSPLSPAELMARHRREAEKTMDNAEKALLAYAATPQNNENIWNLCGREAILSRVRASLKTAKRRVLVEMWGEEAEELKEDLRAAFERGLDLIFIITAGTDLGFGTTYLHDYSGRDSENYGARWLNYSADDREVIAGVVSLGSQSKAAWTMHPALVMPITEYMVHDIYVQEILREFRPELEDRFGPGLERLRKKFLLNPRGKLYYSPFI